MYVIFPQASNYAAQLNSVGKNDVFQTNQHGPPRFAPCFPTVFLGSPDLEVFEAAVGDKPTDFTAVRGTFRNDGNRNPYMCHGQKSLYLGMVISPLIGILIMGI